MVQEIEHPDFGPSLRLTNSEVEVIVPIGFGPRVPHYSFDGSENILGWHPEAAVNTGLGTWKPYGGHRLWMAPENMPLSYSPDNDAVGFIEDGQLSIRLIPPE